MHRRSAVLMVLLLAFSAQTGLLLNDLAPALRADATGGAEATTITLPAGGEVARYLDLGPDVLEAGMTAEIEGLFDDLAYMPTPSVIADMVVSMGTACLLTVSSEIACFSVNSGSNALLGQNSGWVNNYFSGQAPLSVPAAEGRMWTSIHGGHTGQSDFFCAVDDANVITCWGQLGIDSNSMDVYYAEVVDDAREPVVQVELGASHACALYESGRLGCWGEVSRASGHPNNDYTFNGSLNVIEPPVGASITDLLVGREDSCMRVDNGELLCWGNRHGSSTPTNDTTYAGKEMGATVMTMLEIRDANWNSGHCLLFDNGTVGCYGVAVDSAHRGNATTPSSMEDMTMVDLPAGTQAVGLWSPGSNAGALDAPVCAYLDDGTTACWGSEYNASSMSWNALTTPTVLTDLPNGTVSVGIVVTYSSGGVAVALDADGRAWQTPLETWNRPSNRTAPASGPEGYSGWYGVDLAGNLLSGMASTVGTHDLTLWVNDSTGGATAYDFVIEVVEPFADTSTLYEYEIGRRISQDFDVDALCNPAYGMNCQAFFWPAAPNGLGISMMDWNFDPMMGGQWVEPEFGPKVRGTALGNVQSSDYTIVVQQWASVYGMENSPWQSGDFSNINTLALNVTLRSSTESYGRLPVASGFPFEATADFLLPFIASSESFELDGAIGGFDLNITTEDRSFETVRMVRGAVCADGSEGTSCYGSVSSMFGSYQYNYPLVRPTADVNYNAMAASPISVTPIIDADLDGIVLGDGSACWMNSQDQVVCGANQGASYLGYLGDEMTLNAMGLAPTAMWDGATASSFAYVPSWEQGYLCASLTNLTLVCNVGTNNPVLSGDAGDSTVWIENANVTAFVPSGYSNGLCVLAGEGDLGEGIHCAGEYLDSRHFVEYGSQLASGVFHAVEAAMDDQGAPAVPTSVFQWYGACSQFDNNTVRCLNSWFNSTNASRNWGGSDLPALFTVPGMGAVVPDTSLFGSSDCVLDDLGQVFCMEITTSWDEGMSDGVSHIRDFGVEVYNHTAESQWSGEWKRLVVRKVDFGGPVVDLANSWEHMAAVLDDGRLMTIGSVPDRMGIGESAFNFGVNYNPNWTPTNTTQVNPTVVGLTISGTPPAGYGDSPIVSVWGNSSYGEQAEPQTGFTWDGEAANVYPFVLDYVHAVEFEHGYLEVLTSANVSIPVEVYCDWCTDFAFSPALPGDWTFDSESGMITGTPGTAGAAVTYTVTASAANGSDTTEVTIRVVDAYTEPSLGGMDLTSTSESNPQQFLVNVALTDIMLVDDEGVTSEWTITPDLPIGMHLDTKTGRIFGTPALLDDAPVAYVINASSPMGTSAEVTVWMQVVSEFTVPLDTDGDGTPDSEDDDDDNDGVVDSEDAFPLDPTESADLDGDGIGNNADDDADGDGVPASEDQNDLDASVGAATVDDMDGDGIPDAQDTDRDGDGVDNDLDAFPDDASETVDTDGDGTGDGADSDDDGDGVADADDAFPLDASESADLDGDGVGDNSDTDADGDGVLNDVDQDDMDATVGAADTGSNGTDTNGTDNNTTVSDLDGDGTPDAEDDDIDGDGVPNAEDLFPEDATESADLDGDGVGDNMDDDADGDGIPASEDADDFDASVGRIEAGGEDEGGNAALTLALVVLGIIAMLFIVLRRSDDDKA
jgi:hypothetical protein